jgi:hypothetical protein
MWATGRNFNSIEDDFIRSNYGSMSLGVMARTLERSFDGVNKRVRKLGLKRKTNRQWSDAEDQVIRMGEGRKLGDVAKELGRCVSEVSARWKKIGDGSSWAARGGFNLSRGRKVIRFSRENSRYSRAVFEHRDNMEKHIGRKLGSSEIVHHVDLDKGNNEIDNLHVFPGRSEHRKAHYSIELLIPSLLQRGIVRFNRSLGVYELCEIDN